VGKYFIFSMRKNSKYKEICELIYQLYHSKITVSKHTVVVLMVSTLCLKFDDSPSYVKSKMHAYFFFIQTLFLSFLWIRMILSCKRSLFLWFIKCPWREIGGRRKPGVLSFPLTNNFLLCCFDLKQIGHIQWQVCKNAKMFTGNAHVWIGSTQYAWSSSFDT
jgi:hypothetical protein